MMRRFTADQTKAHEQECNLDKVKTWKEPLLFTIVDAYLVAAHHIESND